MSTSQQDQDRGGVVAHDDPALQRWQARARSVLADPMLVPALVAVYACAAVAVVVARRAMFPWDLLLWSESPFMTNMLKLRTGGAVFSSPADGNAFVYSPGLEYLCEALLRPFGADLDVRACRVVAVIIGVLAAIFAALAARRLAGWDRLSRLGTTAFALLAWLVISRNFTSDLLHPDNLHAAHATACLALTLWMMQTRAPRVAFIAAGVAGLGVFTKQTEAASIAGVLVIAAWTFGVRSRELWKTVAVGTLSTGASFALLFANPNARWYLLTVLGHHEVVWSRVSELPGELMWGERPWIAGLGIVGAVVLVALGRGRFVLAWALLGVTCALPNLLAYLKIMGAFNNLGIIELWMLLPALAATGALRPTIAARVAAVGVFAVIAWQAPSEKAMPSPAYQAYLRSIERRIDDDVRSGKNVLVGHGTSWLIRAGRLTPPLDRENSLLEIATGGQTARTDAARRFDEGTYDRAYVLTDWYPTEVRAAIERRYVETEHVDLVDSTPTSYYVGIMSFPHVHIWTRR